MHLYRNILKQAIRITWQNKYLWFFGLFAALIGSSGEYELIVKGFSGGSDRLFFTDFYNICSTGIFSFHTLGNIGNLLVHDTLTVMSVFFVSITLLALFVFVLWLSVVSQIAIVNNSAGLIAKKKNEFKDGVAAGVKNFWPVLGLNFIVKTIVYLSFAFINLPIAFAIVNIARGGSVKANFLYILTFIIFIPLSVVLSFIIKYAIAFVVIKKESFSASMKKGLAMFKENWLISIEMAFVLFFIKLFIGFVMLVAGMVLAIPFLFLALIFYKIAAVAGFWIVVVLGSIFLLGFIILLGSMLSAFQVSAWTGLFVELVNKGGISKIQRWWGSN